MDDFDDEEIEVEIQIEPRDDVLAEHGISPESFEDALATAIDNYHEQIDRLDENDDVPGVEDMIVRVGDQEFRLGDLAEVHISDESE